MSFSREDYLRVMYEISEEKDSIRSNDIAERMQISRPSVSQMLKKMNGEDLTRTDPYSEVKLTRKGLARAKKMMRKHRIIEVFLKEILDYDISKVHEEAHRLEHAFSDESIRRLNSFLDDPQLSPTNKRIPR